MTEALRIETYGLRDLLGRFARHADRGLQQRQDALLEQVAKDAKEKLEAKAPRGHGSGPHLADSFLVSALQRHGPSATIAVSNTKTVESKQGHQWSLLRLLTPPGTRPHDIPRAFGYPLPFGVGGRFNGKFHPGYAGTPFVSDVIREIDPQQALMRTAQGTIADLAGGGR